MYVRFNQKDCGHFITVASRSIKMYHNPCWNKFVNLFTWMLNITKEDKKSIKCHQTKC